MESKPQIPAPRSVSGDESAASRIGPYHLVRHLVSGPGAQLLQAARDDGTQVLLQIVRCRTARNATEEGERNAMLESVATTTSAIAAEYTIENHGRTDFEGESIVWWELPWDERAVELGMAKIDDPDELLSVGIHLARRLARAHAQNRLDPLLSERLLVIENGEPWIAGVPIRIPDRWLSPGMRAARLAPEEAVAREPTRAGDVWRLGQTLKAMTVYLERLPTRIWRALELLGHPDVGVRVRSADEAASMMESLADPLTPDPPSISEITHALTIRDSNNPDETITQAEDRISGTRRLNDQLDTQPGAKPPRALTAGHVDETGIPAMRRKQGTWDTRSSDEIPTIAPTVGPTGTMLGDKVPSALMKRQTTTPGARRIEANELQPRIAPRGLLAGPKGTMVGVQPLSPNDIFRVPRDRAERESETETQDDITPDGGEAREEDPRSEDVRLGPVPSPRAAGVAVLTFIVGLLLGAVASKVLRILEDNPAILAPAAVIPSLNLVRIDAEPPASAVIVSEEDGQLLGPPPVSIQVSSAQETIAVLVTAPGHEPQRVVLPAQGHFKVVLEPRYTQRESCQVNLHIPQNVPIEGVATSITETASGFQIPGSAVIRAVGELHGAWLVRCPGYGTDGVVTLDGRQLERQVEVRINNPPDMEVWIDGEAIGTSPLRKRVPSGFRQIRLKSGKGESVERWVPLFGDAEIEFPYPN